jgi:hypothetical protein
VTKRLLSFIREKIDARADDFSIEAEPTRSSIRLLSDNRLSDEPLKIELRLRWRPLVVDDIPIRLSFLERFHCWRFIRSTYRRRLQADRAALSTILDTLTTPTR